MDIGKKSHKTVAQGIAERNWRSSRPSERLLAEEIAEAMDAAAERARQLDICSNPDCEFEFDRAIGVVGKSGAVYCPEDCAEAEGDLP